LEGDLGKRGWEGDLGKRGLEGKDLGKRGEREKMHENTLLCFIEYIRSIMHLEILCILKCIWNN